MRVDRGSPGHRARAALLLLCCVSLLPVAAAQQAPSPPAPPQLQGAAPDGNAEHPEYRTRVMPTDTFKPSEQVSEDFAVPFPADI
jgi:hypothetical protein